MDNRSKHCTWRFLDSVNEHLQRLERGRGSGRQQTRMASECGPVYPRGGLLNQGQGQALSYRELSVAVSYTDESL